jgi:hypothetical protein
MSSMFYWKKNEYIVLVGQMRKGALCEGVKEIIRYHDQ